MAACNQCCGAGKEIVGGPFEVAERIDCRQCGGSGTDLCMKCGAIDQHLDHGFCGNCVEAEVVAMLEVADLPRRHTAAEMAEAIESLQAEATDPARGRGLRLPYAVGA